MLPRSDLYSVRDTEADLYTAYNRGVTPHFFGVAAPGGMGGRFFNKHVDMLMGLLGNVIAKVCC